MKTLFALHQPWECEIWPGYDPFLAQCLSKFDVAVEPTSGPGVQYLLRPLPDHLRGWGGGRAAPQGVISGPQLVRWSPGAGRARAEPGTNLVIVLTPLLGPGLHPWSWVPGQLTWGLMTIWTLY